MPGERDSAHEEANEGEDGKYCIWICHFRSSNRYRWWLSSGPGISCSKVDKFRVHAGRSAEAVRLSSRRAQFIRAIAPMFPACTPFGLSPCPAMRESFFTFDKSGRVLVHFQKRCHQNCPNPAIPLSHLSRWQRVMPEILTMWENACCDGVPCRYGAGKLRENQTHRQMRQGELVTSLTCRMLLGRKENKVNAKKRIAHPSESALGTRYELSAERYRLK